MTHAASEVLPHRISIVVPVYRGEVTLPPLLEEIEPLLDGFVSPDGHPGLVSEVLLVHDRGPDDSARVMRELAARYPQVRPVWLSRNFGQHPATLAGMANSTGDWIVTMDEDGQHDPADIPRLLDTAMAASAPLVYAAPTNEPPHGWLRNLLSKGAKRVIDVLTGSRASRQFNSYRFMLGDTARGVAGYAGTGVYLDVALAWVAGDIATCPVELRQEGARPSGYRLRTLFSHFWRLVLTSGTKLLRLVSLVGALLALAGLVIAAYLVVNRLVSDVPARGWTSVMVVILLATGVILFSLGIVAEYVGVAVNIALGKPLFVVVGDSVEGPLGRRPQADRDPAAVVAPTVPPPPSAPAPTVQSSRPVRPAGTADTR